MLFELLTLTARQTPEAVAMVLPDGRRLTYAQLHSAAAAFAYDLSAAGVGPGATAILLLPNGWDFAVSVFALAHLGAIAVPLNPLYPARELEYYFRDSRPAAAVTTAEQAASCALAAEAASLACRVFTSTTATVAHRPHAAGASGDASRMALYQYSSGSTGLPKRVMRTHGNLVAEAHHFVRTVGVTADDRILTVVPLFHAHGFGNCLLAAVRAGCSMVMLETFQRARVVDTLAQEGITIFPGVPFMFGILASSASIRPSPLPRLRLAFSAGAPLPRDVFTGFRDKFGIEVRQLYGSTETGSVAINLESCAGSLWASVGRPMDGIELRVLDAGGQAVAPGENGEIVIRSPAAAASYAGPGGPNAEPSAFRGGDFWSGDVGYQDAAGNLFVTGRTKAFIDTGGYKVDPLEVEQVLNAHPKVESSVVVGVPGRHGREIVKAVVVARMPCSAEEIVAWCHGRIADFKIPRLVEFREEIPISPLGKVLRKYLIEEP